MKIESIKRDLGEIEIRVKVINLDKVEKKKNIWRGDMNNGEKRKKGIMKKKNEKRRNGEEEWKKNKRRKVKKCRDDKKSWNKIYGKFSEMNIKIYRKD